MALDEITKARATKLLGAFCEKRVPRHLWHKVRLHFEIHGRSLTLIEDRPYFQDPSQWTHSPVAQFRHDEETKRWTLYCCDRNSKWHRYMDLDSTTDLEDLIKEVDRDPTGIFWG